ncbi:MAG: hypothetical protein ACYSUT_02245 [Planctomycetota bacterium]
MARKNQEKHPFFMIFPWGKVAGLVFLLIFAVILVYRISETGGLHVSRACLSAMIISLIAGLTGLYVISEMWGKDVYWVLAGVMIAAAIRLLISGAGTAIITFFMDIHRSWFVLFLGVYYIVFLTADTWLALWILRNSNTNKQEHEVHGNLWDMFS